MHNSLKTELHIYAFTPTNEKQCATFVIIHDDEHFFHRHDFDENPIANFFTSKSNRCNDLIFGWSFNMRNAFNEIKKKNQENCTWPSGSGILQSSKTKKLLVNSEFLIKWIG